LNSIQEEIPIVLAKYEIVLHGSFLRGDNRPTSDIDLAIISREQNKENNLQIQWDVLGKLPIIYDVRIFELFPITIQMSIINHYSVINGDPLNISEYFYEYRKKWEDCKHRILQSYA
jgi:uncharacterized protein